MTLPPVQCHQGMRNQIVEWREGKLKKQQQLRREVNERNNRKIVSTSTEHHPNPFSISFVA
jgi:hypothetical protein